MILGIFAVVAVAMLGVSLFFASRRWKAWEEVANELGLQYVGDTITGRLEGVPVEMWTMTSSVHSKRRRTYTKVVAKLERSSMPAGLSVQREGFGSKIAKVVKGDDVQLGLPDLDSKLLVGADDSQATGEWARSGDVRTGLRRVLDLGEDFLIEDGQVQLTLYTFVSDKERIRRLLVGLTRAAALLGEPATNPTLVQADPLGLGLGQTDR